MARYVVTLITGDGTGPELAEAARRCVDAALAATKGAGSIDWKIGLAGVDIMEKAGTPMPDETIALVRSSDVIKRIQTVLDSPSEPAPVRALLLEARLVLGGAERVG